MAQPVSRSTPPAGIRSSSLSSTKPAAPLGSAAYLRIAPEHGSIEIGHIHLSPRLQQTRAATEIQYLLMRHAFDDLGYRRYEWKADALNAPSRRAALRLGFRFEGIFLKAIVYKQRSRDTAWFSIIDDEWPQAAPCIRVLARSGKFRRGRSPASLTREPAGAGITVTYRPRERM